ncbi:mitochondrial import receptor subunit TOM20 [Neltuma alba]|uniref:mitochondrial import receptor subunit TOM20 n=1 Tax=Neltuma alba TaxID=207710 RepID=UPI0010A4BBF5|nr:mitochondrial import receptor subunit TOM20-like [Prosopis alba]XP_028797005.1 mitochondrial import receptor subunit TOM20-like [Prosopis alba]
MVEDSITKLEEALMINPKKPDAVWCLGNAYTSRALLTPDQEMARVDFDRASEHFQQAADDPGNELYRKSLEMAAKASELHKGMHEHGFAQQAVETSGSSISSGTKNQKIKQSSDLKYDIFGWIILAVGIVAWVGFGKPHPPPPSQSALQ